jgi:hypothetical protein
MSPEPHIRRVQLPGGKVIEVVYLDHVPEPAQTVAAAMPSSPTSEPVPEAATPAPAPAPATRSRDLHLCPQCEGRFVHPIDWAEASRDQWRVLLRCPECQWTEAGVFDQASVDRFDRELDDGTETLVRDLQHLTHANMAEQVERFIKALEQDLILPCDF